MPITYREFITREMLHAERDTIFVFGDNLAEAGRGGQAKEMGGEPNSLGIPTKRFPTMLSAAFFTDDDFDEVKAAIDRAINLLTVQLKVGGNVVFPTDGIGTGRAQLARRAPRIRAYLDKQLSALEAYDKE